MSPLIILKARINWRMHVPLDGREIRQFTGLHRFKYVADMAYNVFDLGEQMNRSVMLATVLR